MPSNVPPRSASSRRWYTARGDDGQTHLLDGSRIPKDDLRPEAVGQVDELQAALAVCRAGPLTQKGKQLVFAIEQHLGELMSDLARPAQGEQLGATTGGSPLQTLARPTQGEQTSFRMKAEHTEWLEKEIEVLGHSVPALTGFVVPGDSQAGAFVNLARTIARRAERAVVRLNNREAVPAAVTQYLNRLSSLLFVLVCFEDDAARRVETKGAETIHLDRRQGMTRTVIATDQAPAAVGPYSQGIITDKLVFTAGQIPLDPATGRLVEGDIQAQTRRALQNVQAILEKAGTSMANVVKTTVFLTDMGQFKAMNQVYAEFFPGTPPARSAVQVGALPLGANVEVEAIAVKE